MSITYQRNREYGTGIHVNPDTWNVAHPGEPDYLWNNLASAGLIPTHISCNDTAIDITFESELTPEQIATMDQVIADHKAVADWPPEA